MDCTHSVQRPSAGNGKTVGDRKFVPSMALAAKAFGANGYFFEVHPHPRPRTKRCCKYVGINEIR